MAHSYQYKNDELEKLILGTVLSIYKLSSARRLEPNHFADMRNRVVFEIMFDLDENHQAIDYLSIADHLKMKGIDAGIAYVKGLRDYGVNDDLLCDLVAILQEQSPPKGYKR